MLRTRWLPSRGGMGNRLKKNSDRLMKMVTAQRSTRGWEATDPPGVNAYRNDWMTIGPPLGMDLAVMTSVMKASRTRSRLENGPARVVRLSSPVMWRKLRVTTGVGRAHPI